jgi:D-sedoheptulose 7-phosphate isomerase
MREMREVRNLRGDRNGFGDRNGIADATGYLAGLSAAIKGVNIREIDAGVELVREAWKSGKQIFVCGNGGSALTAAHFVTDWNKGIFLATGIRFRAHCLADNMGLVTAYSNDMSYEDIFVMQLKNLLDVGDLVIGISGSGNSENVLRAIAYANDSGGVTLGLSGFGGGKLRQLAQHNICTNVHDMQLSEDLHLVFGHTVMKCLCASRRGEIDAFLGGNVVTESCTLP